MSRTVVVTGASAGVGRATARAFAEAGYDTALIARDPEGLHAAAREVEANGRRALVLPADVADADRVEEAAARTEEELGPIDVWVNNAMVTVFSRIRDLEPAEIRRVTEVTYLGAVHGTFAALRRMLPRDRGTIVQVGSALSYRAIPLQGAYCAAKHAMRGFTDSLRTELLHDGSGVHVTMVQLPALNTPQFEWCRTKLDHHPQPVPPIYQPEVAAESIVFAAESRRREVLVGTPTVLTILANKIAPSLLDRYLAANGYESQYADRPAEEDETDNLFDPVGGDQGARGIFGDRAHEWSWQFWANRHRRPLAAGALVTAGLTWLIGRR